MKILLITQWFDPEPAFKGLPFARELAKLGHQVEVLTGFPNYPGGKLYDGYKIRFRQREIIDGIRVTRVPLYPSHDRSAVRRAANYASFAISSAVLGPLLTSSFDVAHVYHPPATIGLAALSFRMLRRIPFVYDIQDLWPDTLAASGMMKNRAALHLIASWCRAIYFWASRITVISPGFRAKLVERGVPPEKIEVIYNWSFEDHIHADRRSDDIAAKYGLAGKFNIMFAGTMGLAQRLDSVIDAADRVKSLDNRIQFVFVGGGVDVMRLSDRSRAMNLPNVVFVPRQPVSEIGRFLGLADVLLVHLKRDPLFEITIPSKTQAYMAAGKPILMAVEGDASRLVEMAQAGLTCEPEDPRSIADAALKLASMPVDELRAMGERGRSFYERELSMAVGVRRFEKVMIAAVRERAGTASPRGV